jgi:hypothetical protein
MNSPLEKHEVRLRGLGGPAACGVPRISASATRSSDPIRKEHIRRCKSTKSAFAD